MPVTHTPKPRSVSDVVSNLLQPSLTSHFDVLIGLPQSSLGTQLRRFLGPNQDKLHLMCSEAVLPGSQLATTEMNNDFTGVTERHAYRRIYDETIDLSFFVDAKNYLPIRFFEEWISGAVNEDQREALAKDYFYRDAATTDKPRTILGLGGTDRNSLIADGKDKKLRDSVIVTIHTRNIGETF